MPFRTWYIRPRREGRTAAPVPGRCAGRVGPLPGGRAVAERGNAPAAGVDADRAAPIGGAAPRTGLAESGRCGHHVAGTRCRPGDGTGRPSIGTGGAQAAGRPRGTANDSSPAPRARRGDDGRRPDRPTGSRSARRPRARSSGRQRLDAGARRAQRDAVGRAARRVAGGDQADLRAGTRPPRRPDHSLRHAVVGPGQGGRAGVRVETDPAAVPADRRATLRAGWRPRRADGRDHRRLWPRPRRPRVAGRGLWPGRRDRAGRRRGFRRRRRAGDPPAAGPSRFRIDFGAGIWGSAQRGAARLDIGPTIGVAVPIARRAIRLSADWRERIAGDARPGSGPAFTIGSDF